MSPFWNGVLAGFGIAIPVGAIAILIIENSLRRGFRFGFAAGAGAAVADLLYALLAAVAGAALAASLAPLAAELRLASAGVLVVIGGLGLRRAYYAPRSAPEDAAPATQGRAPLWVFAQFLGLTLLNPLTVTYFAALILGQGSQGLETHAARFAFVLGAGLASFSWQTFLAALGALGRSRLPPRAQQVVSIIGNLIVIALGLRLVV